MRAIRYIFVHCTAGNRKQTVEALLEEFKRKGWKNPGYHFVVTEDGKIHSLLPVAEIANGVQGFNSVALHVAWTGGIDAAGKPTDNRTDEQKKTLKAIVEKLHKQYPTANVMGHRDIWGSRPSAWKKMCPCFDVKKEYADILR